jgi:hypothetical protein
MQSIQLNDHTKNSDSPGIPRAMKDSHTNSPQIQNNNDEQRTRKDTPPVQGPDFKRGMRFWCIIAGLSVTSLQSSLENSVIVTAGPAIVQDLGMGEEYIWITNAFFLCWYVRLFSFL